MAVSKVEDISQNNDDVEISKKDKKARKRKKGIYRKIVAQMEFYLSDANLRHSKFLLPIYQTDPWIDLKLFLTFNKVASMLSEIVGQEANEESKGKASKETAVVLTMMIDTTKTAKQKLKEAAAARRNEKA